MDINQFRMDELLDSLKDKKNVIKFLLKTIDSNAKISEGLRKIIKSDNNEFKTNKLLEVVANQSIQIKQLSALNLLYVQSIYFDVDVAQLLNKMGRGEEALKQMLKNKLG